jgi:hypothetical protein
MLITFTSFSKKEVTKQTSIFFYSVADPYPGSGIGCLFDPGILDGRKSASGSGIRNEQPESCFLKLRNHLLFLGVKILKVFDDDLAVLRIRDVYPGSYFVPSRIPHPNCLHPGSRILMKRF